MNERTGRSEWNGDAAKREPGWATATPMTVAEKVETVRDLMVDETVAAQAACELLHRPEVAFHAMRDPQARELVNCAPTRHHPPRPRHPALMSLELT